MSGSVNKHEAKKGVSTGVLNLTWFCQLFFTLFLFFDVQKKSDFWQKSDFSVL
jgi:hypothetical protein